MWPSPTGPYRPSAPTSPTSQSCAWAHAKRSKTGGFWGYGNHLRNLHWVPRGFFPQLYSEQEHQASDPEEPFLKPQGPSLLMLQALQELDLTACSKLTDASLAKVLQFPQLRQLSLSLLPALTDNGLVAVARGCPSLEHLSLSHCSCLSDDDWAQAAGSWLRLQHLNLSSCSQLTEQTLDTNSQVCKQLQVLDVAMCPGINVVAVRHFQAQLPQVTCEGLT
ncbi:leucine-rich repeat-containing protein 29 isoform X10 [Heterocephalus glaber]|uniref:Leucine-rich repeat-containing protein 29 isoform X10 n=1 Tax=Heterocephalus glaber TaxID=10181 RepID=A0AAX6SXJ4_HETGA|nr:leucine-rich repeat-containing protein 29 isoform X10 [Heterocephalus glaber]XP_021112550.1 leucine-rich repeat-containing protein 29 isoform X10 [Heterocephalus glaber]XP_021112551.1 leucine-rich repeat-containing protein 29 isoform X10 [Heterocephalus glaber]XP_021112552.1 leucine-rich repeat-containing protein 29 isoform X10 [Heterocephalus glaber]XP_021112553.1 leucine-rich repeat-containing protein 29 isoform X10 [Heterocephalus glaber]